MSTNRATSECITLRFVEFDEYGDGSATIRNIDYEKCASVGILQPQDIERLEKAGIICRNGVTVVIRDAPEFRPDLVLYNGRTFRIVSWAFDYESQRNDGWDEYVEHFGTVVATCDEMTIAGDQ